MTNELNIFVGEEMVTISYNEEMDEYILSRGIRQELTDPNPCDVARALRELDIRFNLDNCKRVAMAMAMMLEW